MKRREAEIECEQIGWAGLILSQKVDVCSEGQGSRQALSISNRGRADNVFINISKQACRPNRSILGREHYDSRRRERARD